MDEREGNSNKYSSYTNLLFAMANTHTDILIRNFYWKPEHIGNYSTAVFSGLLVYNHYLAFTLLVQCD